MIMNTYMFRRGFAFFDSIRSHFHIGMKVKIQYFEDPLYVAERHS